MIILWYTALSYLVRYYQKTRRTSGSLKEPLMKGIRALVLCLMVLCLAATGCIPVPVAVPVQQNGYYTVPRTYYGYPQQGYYYRPVPPPAPHYVPYVPRRLIN
jgi:hypothetical protein